MIARCRLLVAGLASIVVLSPPTVVGDAAGGGESPAAALLSAAERRARDGDLEGALADYEQIVQQFHESPQAPEALLRIAQGRRDAGDRPAALATVERLVTTYPGAPQAAGGLLLEGRLRSERPTGLDDLEGARKALEKVWLLFPRAAFPALPARAAARVLDGEIALRLGRDAEALTSFLEVVELEPASPSTAAAHIGMGAALIRAGEWQAAAECLQEALSAAGASAADRALARRRLALLERRLLRPAAGEPLWRRARPTPIPGTPPKRLTGVAASDRGRLLLADAGADALVLLSAAGEVEQRWSARRAERPSWGPDSAGYLAAGDAVLVPGEASKGFQIPGKDKGLDGIRAVERGPYGEWIVLAARSQGVLSYPAGRGPGRTLLGGDGDPVDLATDALDRLYVLERRGRRVVRLDPRTERAETLVRGAWRQAAAVAVDPFGYVHVLDGGGGRVHTYDPSGEEIGATGPLLPGNVELRKADDLAAGGDGRLYVADARAGLIVLE